MIEIRELTKRYGRTVAVDHLSFTIRPGVVTGFLGPNGAGKTTTMRVLLGLDAPDGGAALIKGVRYRDLEQPLRTVGALLDASAVHPGRKAGAHLAWLAAAAGLAPGRVAAALELTGLAGVAGRRVGGFSLGMRQRLGLAAALLGDPEVLVLDEPVNGLDPEGIRWIRTLLRSLAAEGRTVLVSSHLIAEMALTADHLVVVGRGRLIADTPLAELVEEGDLLVRTADDARFAGLLRGEGAEAEEGTAGISVRGLEPGRVSGLAAAHGIDLLELARRGPSLEESYVRLTERAVEHRAGGR